MRRRGVVIVYAAEAVHLRIDPSGRGEKIRRRFLAKTLHGCNELFTSLPHRSVCKCKVRLLHKVVEKPGDPAVRCSVFRSLGLKKESPLGGCAVKMVNLGGGGRP